MEPANYQQFNDQQVSSVWEVQANKAFDSGDMDKYRWGTVNRWVARTIAIAKRQGWSSWKTRSVCKYITKVFENMAIAELASISDAAAVELITHASDGFDAFEARRNQRRA